jgi:hypothetical protein
MPQQTLIWSSREMALDRKSILAADDVRKEKIHVPEWKGDVFLRVLTGTDRDRFEESYADQKMKAFRIRFLLLALCDEDGERLFTDEESDILGKKSSVVINRLFEAGWKLNAFTQEAVDALGEDSEAAPSGGSTSA